MRRIRSTSPSSASASWSTAARWTSTSIADLVADGHLVDEAAEIECQLGDPRGQLIAAASQVDYF